MELSVQLFSYVEGLACLSLRCVFNFSCYGRGSVNRERKADCDKLDLDTTIAFPRPYVTVQNRK